MDIRPLKNLKKLIRLELVDSRVTDLSPLYEVKSLKELYITYDFFEECSEEVKRFKENRPDCLIGPPKAGP